MFDRPHTPPSVSNSAFGYTFTSPPQTPQGSPSKNRMPPGATELSSLFDNALRLAPPSPTKQGASHSPDKGIWRHGDYSDYDNEDVFRADAATAGRVRNNKENAPPAPLRLGGKKELALNPTPSQAALSRHEAYQPREPRPATRAQMRGLTPEELEKLQSPSVKRLANVTQLCKFELW